jgi:uracil-DNA glycosylase
VNEFFGENACMPSSLEDLAQQITGCEACGLSRGRTKAVPGEGPARPTLLFIGEAPGANEDKQGRPFVGQAGALLEQLLAAIDLRRTDVFITNIVKCRPPENRDPLPGEVSACVGYLQQQIELLNPRMIVTLGRYSMAHFFPKESISRVHGVPRQKDALTIFPMYHPAAALHQPSLKAQLEADMRKIPAALARLAPLPEEAPPSQQLSLF